MVRDRRVRELVRPDEVATPDLGAVDAELSGEDVHQALVHERRDREPDTAVGALGALVRRHRAAPRPVALDAVGPRDHARRARGLEEMALRVDAVRAHVADDVGLEAEQAPVRARRRANAHLLVARVAGGQQVLAAILDPLDGPAQLARQPGHDDLLRVHVRLLAEAAADVGAAHPAGLERKLEQLRRARPARDRGPGWTTRRRRRLLPGRRARRAARSAWRSSAGSRRCARRPRRPRRRPARRLPLRPCGRRRRSSGARAGAARRRPALATGRPAPRAARSRARSPRPRPPPDSASPRRRRRSARRRSERPRRRAEASAGCTHRGWRAAAGAGPAGAPGRSPPRGRPRAPAPASASRRTISPCATGLRRKATSSVPGRRMSSTNSPPPDRSRRSSTRGSDCPSRDTGLE